VLPTIHIPITEIFSPLCGEGADCLRAVTAINEVFDQKPIALSAILLVFIAHYVLFYTRWGLRTRAVGEHPKAADTVGINVIKMRYANVMIGGALAGLAGAYFTIESVPSFEPLLTNGRGFISLAAMIFGNWTPIGSWTAALVFGASQALNINIQIFRDVIPPQWAFLQQAYIVGLIPYILTMIILTGIIGRTTPPAADGVPYDK
jgi:simple sugar transport system permease protein